MAMVYDLPGDSVRIAYTNGKGIQVDGVEELGRDDEWVTLRLNDGSIFLVNRDKVQCILFGSKVVY